MNNVIKSNEYQTQHQKEMLQFKQLEQPNVISLDLAQFLFEEIKDHVEKLHDLVMTEDPDTEQAAYHHEKFLRMFHTLRVSKLGGA